MNKYIKYLIALAIMLLMLGCDEKKSKENIAQSGKNCHEQCGLAQENSYEFNLASFVIIDQTTVFNPKIINNLLEKSKPLYSVGSKLVVVKFSTTTQNCYTSVALETSVDNPMSKDEEDDTPIAKVKKFNRCIEEQAQKIKKDAPEIIKSTLEESNSTIGQSEIFKSLKDIATSKIQTSRAKKNIIIIASDMLENSSVTSFYKNNRLRELSTETELSKIKKAGLLTDFNGAYVYIVGAGLTNSKESKSINTTESLKKFWKTYFEQSNATLIGFGTPELMNDIEVNNY